MPEAWRAIRIRQLLGHTSGLPDIVDQKGLIGGGSERDAWKAVKGLPMDAPVGDRFAYNQTNYGLLAQIISKQVKMPYEQYVADRQFAPANMPLSTRAAFIVYPDDRLAIIVLTNLAGANPQRFIPQIAKLYKPL